MNKHEVLNLMTLEEKVLLLQAKDGWDAAAHKTKDCTSVVKFRIFCYT